MIRSWSVMDQVSKRVLLQGHLEKGLYRLQSTTTLNKHSTSNLFSPSSLAITCLAQSNDANLWHNRLGHHFFNIVKKVLNNCNLKFSTAACVNFCSSCQLGKSHRLQFVLLNPEQ
ncbi:hypothetical protein ACOSQ3_009852 [Xanthoceras sorbifolium]